MQTQPPIVFPDSWVLSMRSHMKPSISVEVCISLNRVSLKHIKLQSLYSCKYFVFALSSSSLLQRERALSVIIVGSGGFSFRLWRRTRSPPFLPRLRGFRSNSSGISKLDVAEAGDPRKLNSSLRVYSMRACCNGHSHSYVDSEESVKTLLKMLETHY